MTGRPPETLTVLLLDAGDDVEPVLRQALERLGHRVVAASDGGEATLVLLDATSPSGARRPAEVAGPVTRRPLVVVADAPARWLARAASWPGPVIGVSGGEDEALQAALRVGAAVGSMGRPLNAD